MLRGECPFLSRVYYSERYTLPLPEGHRFPIGKYRMLRDRLVTRGILPRELIFESPLASDETLALAHDPAYIRDVREGSLPRETLLRIGFPWSFDLYLRSCATVGGAVGAAEAALQDGLSGNLAGGTHHAHRDRGEGYCVFNDLAVATRVLQLKHGIERVAIIDLDVHQGNGNSSILGGDPGVFIFSMHGEKNYPFRKVPSSLDIGLADGTGDEEYLRELRRGLAEVKRFRPQFIFYQSGVDPLASDRLGKLSLSFEGLKARDRLVFHYAFTESIPLSLALGGGYAEPIDHSVEAYANTYEVARELYEIEPIPLDEMFSDL